MHAVPTTHPTPAQLAAYGLGKLDEAGTAAVARHLERCDACRRAVEHQPADSFVGLVRAAKNPATALPAGAPAAPKGAPVLPQGPAAQPLAGLPAELAQHPRFRILRELGRGGMGVVYQAEHRMMERLVAIKVINKSVIDKPATLERFHREVKAAAKLDHPNIVRAYDAEQAGALHLLVMEFVEGADLATMLNKQGPLPLAYACHFARQAALGLQHAFEQGMVHRDIKPQNLMLTSKGVVKILDFGLTRLASERGHKGNLTQLGAFMGTPEYIAPEQALDARQADIRADIYSLGCTLYTLLAGRVPFQEPDPVSTALAHVEKEATALHELRREVPAQLSAVVARMMAKDPGQRYQTPLEVAQALLPFCKAGAKPEAKGGSAPRPQVRSAGRGTMIPGDTSKLKELQLNVARKALAKEEPENDQTANAFENLGEPAAPPNQAKAARKAAKAVPARRSRRWAALIGLAAGLVLALGLGTWLVAWMIFQPKPKDGILEEVTLEEGGQKIIRATIKPVPPGKPANVVEAKQKSADGGPTKVPGEKELPKTEAVDLGGGMKMEFVLIPKGSFKMGSPPEEKGRNPSGPGLGVEKQHEVQISKPFYLAKYPVTQQQYKTLMKENPSWFQPSNGSAEKVKGLDTQQFPVESVSWSTAQAFCKKMRDNDRQARKFRLPTEAEWEYACRAGTKTAYFFGDDERKLGEYAWFASNSGDRTHKVGTRNRNRWGLYDMHGNVWQWCEDDYEIEYYSTSPKKDPLNVNSPRLAAQVLRGGSWINDAPTCRAAHRMGRTPEMRNYFCCYGFRVAFCPETEESKASKADNPTLPVRPVADKDGFVALAQPLDPAEQAKVDEAIKKGVAYLKTVQNEDGSWSPGTKSEKLAYFKVGYSALAGLTLLECGVKPEDDAIKRTTEFIRASAPAIDKTYDLALAILFLDRLGHGKAKSPDKALIQKLALRLVAGQTVTGGWTYQCPTLSDKEQEVLLSLLKKHQSKLASPLELQQVEESKLVLPGQEVPKSLKKLAVWRDDADPKLKGPKDSDNSNTQFAILGLWVAKQYDLPLERTLALMVKRFRKSQNDDGSWGYLAYGREIVQAVEHPTMTCAGLLGLAVGLGLTNEAQDKLDNAQPRLAAAKDPQVKKALELLAEYIGLFHKPWKQVSLIDLYFIWSVERVAVVYGLGKIGDKDWYAWGAEMLVANQTAKGNWENGRYPESTPVIDTCFALLFLKKANFARDLTLKLQPSAGKK